jgi:phage baseplate assembly protein W
MRPAKYVEHKAGMRKAYNILVETPEGKRPHRRLLQMEGQYQNVS